MNKTRVAYFENNYRLLLRTIIKFNIKKKIAVRTSNKNREMKMN